MNEPFLTSSSSMALSRQDESASSSSWWESITNALPCFRRRKGLLLSSAELEFDGGDLSSSDGSNIEALRQQLRALELRLLQAEQREKEERVGREAAVRELEKEKAMRERTVEALAAERKARPASTPAVLSGSAPGGGSVPLVEHQRLLRELQDERAAKQKLERRLNDEQQQLTQ